MDSLNKRYFYKLSTNLVGLIINVLSQTMITRGLGPKAYGDFSYLSNFFTQIFNFISMGTSYAFYTKLSQRQDDLMLISFYVYFSGIITSIVVIILAVISYSPITPWLFPNQTILIIYMALLLAILMWFYQIFNFIIDAFGLTVRGELCIMTQKIVGFLLIVLLFVSDKLILSIYYLYQYIITIFVMVFLLIIIRGKIGSQNIWKLPLKKVIIYLREFYSYSHPLFILSLAVLFVGIFDRWMLEVYSGSLEQGYYGLVYQISSVSFIFTSAMTLLLIREFTIAFDSNDIEHFKYLFDLHIPLLYSITAYFSCFISVHGDKIINVIGGKSFIGASQAMRIMAFYPIHQTYGQLSGSIFLATGQTSLYRNIGVIISFLGIPIVYFLIASKDQSGFDAGASGLAIKMVGMQILAVNAQLYFNTKLLGLSFSHYVMQQIMVIGLYLLIAFGVFCSLNRAVQIDNVIFNILINGIIYTILVAIILYFKPEILGVRKNSILQIKNKLLRSRSN